MNKPLTPRNAFSLVELSLVLVILGLLVGSVLAGQSLIRSAELRAVTTEYNRWITATQNFKDKYNALPGDMSNATTYWGSVGAACSLIPSNSATTCNGNGDGFLDGNYSGSIGNEFFRYWQHLANAGFIQGSYTGIRYYVATDGAESAQFDNAQRGINTPIARMNNATWAAVGLISYPLQSYTTNFDANYGNNVLIFGGNLPNAPATGPILKPEEAWSIDTKMDDGMPALGKLMSGYDTNVCVTGAANAGDITNAQYNVSNGAPACYLIFTSAF